MYDFLSLLFKENEVINLRFIYGDEPVINEFVNFNKNGGMNLLNHHVKKHNKKYSCYFGVMPREGKSKNKITRISSCFVDIDSKDFKSEEEFQKHITELKENFNKLSLMPSIEINSGHGLHFYWLFDEKTEQRMTESITVCKNGNQENKPWRELQEALILFCKGDKSIKDLPRIFRLPFTVNRKIGREPINSKVIVSNNVKFSYNEFLPVLKNLRIENEEKKIDKTCSSIKDNNKEDAIIKVLSEYGGGLFDNFDDFRNIMMAFKYCGYSYEDLDVILQNSSGYNYEDNLKRFEKCQPDGRRGFSTICYYAKMANPGEFEKVNKRIKKEIRQAKNDINYPNTENNNSPIVVYSKKRTRLEILTDAKEFLNSNYDFRSNVITNKTEIRKKNSDWQELTDQITADLYQSLQELDINFSIENLRLLLISSSFSPLYNPFLEYFDNLPEWDGKDYIKEFTDCFVLKNEDIRHEFIRDFTKWFVAIQTGVYNREWCNHTIFIITGEQGDGKTTILNKLMPEVLKRYLQIGCPDFDSKDSAMDMCSKLLINIDELEGFTKKDTDQLKSLITKKHFDIRLPYGHFSKKLEKCCSFMASTNRNSFLNDPTGSRRFLIFEVFKVLYENSFDVNGMYSQAKHLYFSGFQYFFTKEEIESINKRNEKFTSDSMEEQLLLQYFHPGPLELAEQMNDIKRKEKGISFQTTTEIASEICKFLDNKISINDRFIKKLGSFLRKHNFNRIYKNRNYVWCVKLNTSSTLDTEPLMEDYQIEDSPF